MTRLHLSKLIMMPMFAAALLVGPSESQAIFHWCKKCAAPPPAPVIAPPPPTVSYYSPCAPPIVANYVPQTYYRPVTVNTPVTTYQPVQSCGLCGPTTSMRPVTTVVQSTQYVPYTSYRLMYSSAYAPAYTANYLAAPVAAAPVMPAPPVMAAPAPAAPCCGQGAPALGAPIPSAPSAGATTPMPSLSGPVEGSAGYVPQSSSNYPSDPVPDYLKSNTTVPPYTTQPAPGASNYGGSGYGSSNYGNSTTGGTSTWTPSPSTGTTTPSTTTPSTPTPAPSMPTPAAGSEAPRFDPLQTTPPNIYIKPTPEPSTQADPASVTPRRPDADNHTAARAASVIPAVYTQPIDATTSGWRPSSR